MVRAACSHTFCLRCAVLAGGPLALLCPTPPLPQPPPWLAAVVTSLPPLKQLMNCSGTACSATSPCGSPSAHGAGSTSTLTSDDLAVTTWQRAQKQQGCSQLQQLAFPCSRARGCSHTALLARQLPHSHCQLLPVAASLARQAVSTWKSGLAASAAGM